MKESKDLFSRIVIGTVLIITGTLIHYALAFQVPKPRDFFEAIGTVFCILAYGIVANLFILLGLKYYFGTGGWFEKHVSSSLKQIFFLSILIAIIIVIIILVLQVIS